MPVNCVENYFSDCSLFSLINVLLQLFIVY